MDISCAKVIENGVDALNIYFSLPDKDKKALYPILMRGIRSTIDIIELIIENRMTYYEIAEQTGFHHETIRQKLNALAKGGFRIDLDEVGAIARTGRPRKLIRYREEIS